MTQWKLTLAYHGQGFHGWQVQPGLPTVQGALAEALRAVSGETVLPQGAGRTDTGVHALQQVCSFGLLAPIPPDNLQRALNRLLPAGVRVLGAEVVDTGFHARHSARGKVYEYRIFERRQPCSEGGSGGERVCSPFLAPFAWDCRWPLELEPMQEAARFLLGTHDFTAMSASVRERDRADAPNPVKTLTAAEWTRAEGLLRFRVEGSGFLHHMVRNLVGTLVDVGRGSLEPGDLPGILASRRRSEAGPTAPAHGLYLARVLYPARVAAGRRETEADLALEPLGLER